MRSTGRWVFVIFVAVFAVYLSDGRAGGPAGDSIPARYLPFALLGSGTIFLDPVREVVDLPGNYWAHRTKDSGKLGSLFPIWTPIVITPLYVPAVGYLNIKGWSKDRLEALGLIMERVSAAALTAGAVVFLFLALRRRGVALREALFLTFAFAFATGAWSTSSRELWMHGLAQLLCAMSLWLISGPPSRSAATAFGLLIGLLACNRTPDVVMAAGMGCAGLVWAGRRWWLILIAAAIPCVMTVGYNLYFWHSLMGAWGMTGVSNLRGYSMWRGIAGLLVSPTRGIFVFTPFLLFVPFGIYVAFRNDRDRLITAFLLLAIVGQVVITSMYDWRAGWSYGPRYLVDTLPIWIWLLAPALPVMATWAKALLVALVCFSVWVEYIGVFHRNSSADHRIFAKDDHGIPYWPLAWDWRNTPYKVERKNLRQPATLWAYFSKL